MNRRQRRGVVLLVLTAVGAITVFIFVLVYMGQVAAQVGTKVKVYQLTKDVAAYKPVDASAYQLVDVPARWTTAATIQYDKDKPDPLAGKVAATTLLKGSLLQNGMVVPHEGAQPGYREITIIVDAETGVAGKVTPGVHVDILSTTAGADTTPACAEVVISNAEVVDVGVATEIGGSGGDMTNRSGVPVTFTLTSQDALKLAYVESFSVKLRLALRDPGDDTDLPPGQRMFCGFTPTDGGD